MIVVVIICIIWLDFGGELRYRDHLEDLEVDGRVVLKFIFKKWAGGRRVDLPNSGYGHVQGCCVNGNEHSRSIKFGDIVD